MLSPGTSCDILDDFVDRMAARRRLTRAADPARIKFRSENRGMVSNPNASHVNEVEKEMMRCLDRRKAPLSFSLNSVSSSTTVFGYARFAGSRPVSQEKSPTFPTRLTTSTCFHSAQLTNYNKHFGQVKWHCRRLAEQVLVLLFELACLLIGKFLSLSCPSVSKLQKLLTYFMHKAPLLLEQACSPAPNTTAKSVRSMGFCDNGTAKQSQTREVCFEVNVVDTRWIPWYKMQVLCPVLPLLSIQSNL